MKHLKMSGAAVLLAALSTLAVASNATATTLEVGGVTQAGAVAITATLASGTTATLKTTSGTFLDTCTSSEIKGTTFSPYTASAVGGGLSTLTFNNCTHTTHVIFPGAFAVGWTAGTNGQVASSGAEVEVETTTFGVVLDCTTVADIIGNITGTASGHATLDVNAVIDCGFFVPSAKWEGSYTVTSPTGLGVEA